MDKPIPVGRLRSALRAAKARQKRDPKDAAVAAAVSTLEAAIRDAVDAESERELDAFLALGRKASK